MPTPPQPHPDRLAATLLQVLQAGEVPATEAARPGPGSADCRMDLKLQLHRARRCMAASAAAAEHLEAVDERCHPDLWAGTVRDGVARGFATRLEEACSLAPESPAEHHAERIDALEGPGLRRKKDLLVAARGARARFTRKGGVLLVDRAADLHTENCLWFEARRDLGTLDGFVADAAERPRLFSAQFLKPVRYETGEHIQQLSLRGSLGRGAHSWPCDVTLRGDDRSDCLSVTIELPRAPVGWRLRARWLGVPAQLVHHECEPVREVVDGPRGGFVADTLARTCAQLQVGDQLVETPGAAALGPLRHRFWLGASEARTTAS